MKRYVAMLTAVFLLALAAAAQTGAGPKPGPPPNFGSAHGACGPGQPYVEQRFWKPIGLPPPGFNPNTDDTITGFTRRFELVMVGRVANISVAAGREYGVWTTATFNYPLILKSPPGGPASGVPKVSVRFLGGTAMFQGVCTRQFGSSLYPGSLYLVFAWTVERGRHRGQFGGEASPVEEPSGLLTEQTGPHIYIPPGKPNALTAVVGEIRAELEREKSAAGAPPR
ncbi:MAG: hypothetical protein ACRD2F_02125 [Terriglobales bacterium]